MPKYTCFFAHHNSHAKICRYVYTYLDHLAALDFQIAFISNSPLSPGDRFALEENRNIFSITERENTGNDFGAWKWALDQSILPPDTDYLILTNDSNFGPISDLVPVLQSMCAKPGVDFWGLTDSYQGSWHIQSYFMCLSKKVFTSSAFRKVFSQDFSRLPKKEIITNGEILLTAELSRDGFTGQAWIPYKKLDPDSESIFAHNPTHYFYNKLITDFNFPFVKKELVLQNPENLTGINALLGYIDNHTDYPVEDITDALIQAFEPVAPVTDKKPLLSVLCHMYYPSSIYYFMLTLSPLKSYSSRFIFNLSAALFNDKYFFNILTRSFPNAVILTAPNKGRDIGGKLSIIDAFLKLNEESDYSLIIHDKLSPHTPTGKTWRNTLFRIIDEKNLQKIFRSFEREKTLGVVTANEFVKNEYDPDRNSFNCTSKENLISYIKAYNLAFSNYNFAAGTIFWIRTNILRSFFEKHPPLQIREGLETGNALDFNKGTNIHAWERLFSLIANAQGYKITGI